MKQVAFVISTAVAVAAISYAIGTTMPDNGDNFRALMGQDCYGDNLRSLIMGRDCTGQDWQQQAQAQAQPFPVPRAGCPSGYYTSGSFCAPTNPDSRPAVPKPPGANCPSGWYQSGGACVKLNR